MLKAGERVAIKRRSWLVLITNGMPRRFSSA